MLSVGHDFQNLTGPESCQENLHGRSRSLRFDRVLAEAVSANPADKVQVHAHDLVPGLCCDEREYRAGPGRCANYFLGVFTYKKVLDPAQNYVI